MNKQGIDARGRIYIQVLVALGLLLMFVAPVSAGWYQGYQHRIKFNITGSSDGYLENWNGTYIKVFNTSGSNSGHDLYITDTINPDFSDIRIVDASNDQLMRSYINSYGSNYANITYIFDYLDKSEIRDVYVYWDNISAEQYSNNTEEVGDDIGAIPITNTQFAWDMESADNSNTWRLRPIEGSGSLGVIQHLPPSFSPLATFTDTSWYTEGAGSLAEKAAATGTDNPGADYYERNRDASYLYANFTTLRVNGSDAYTGHGATFTVDVKISSACYGDSPKPYNNTGSFWEPSSSTAQWAIFPTTNLPVTFKNCQMAPTPPDENGAFNDTPQTYDYTGTATMTIDGWGTTGYSADCVSGDRCEPVARTDAGVWTNRTTSWESHSNIYLDNIRDVHRVVTNVPGSQEFYAEENIPASNLRFHRRSNQRDQATGGNLQRYVRCRRCDKLVLGVWGWKYLNGKEHHQYLRFRRHLHGESLGHKFIRDILVERHRHDHGERTSTCGRGIRLSRIVPPPHERISEFHDLP